MSHTGTIPNTKIIAAAAFLPSFDYDSIEAMLSSSSHCHCFDLVCLIESSLIGWHFAVTLYPSDILEHERAPPKWKTPQKSGCCPIRVSTPIRKPQASSSFPITETVGSLTPNPYSVLRTGPVFLRLITRWLFHFRISPSESVSQCPKRIDLLTFCFSYFCRFLVMAPKDKTFIFRSFGQVSVHPSRQSNKLSLRSASPKPQATLVDPRNAQSNQPSFPPLRELAAKPRKLQLWLQAQAKSQTARWAAALVNSGPDPRRCFVMDPMGAMGGLSFIKPLIRPYLTLGCPGR